MSVVARPSLPRSQDAAGLPILCAVSSAGLEKQAQVLLNRGADPNAREPVSDDAHFCNIKLHGTAQGHSMSHHSS